MNNKVISLDVLKRFMTDGEITNLMEKYGLNKKIRPKYVITAEDLAMLNRTPKATFEEWKTYLGLSTKEGILRKIGIIYLSQQ